MNIFELSDWQLFDYYHYYLSVESQRHCDGQDSFFDKVEGRVALVNLCDKLRNENGESVFCTKQEVSDKLVIFNVNVLLSEDATGRPDESDIRTAKAMIKDINHDYAIFGLFYLCPFEREYMEQEFHELCQQLIVDAENNTSNRWAYGFACKEECLNPPLLRQEVILDSALAFRAVAVMLQEDEQQIVTKFWSNESLYAETVFQYSVGNDNVSVLNARHQKEQ